MRLSITRAAALLPGVALAALLSHGPARAADAVPAPRLEVTPLRDAGGLPPEPGKPALNVQLTQGLARYLTDRAKGRYTVSTGAALATADDTEGARRRTRKKAKSDGPPPGPQYTLEGELSHVQTGGKDGGPYFCSLRLFQPDPAGGGRRLIHAWSGLARTYLDLTGNLSHDAQVDPEGLLGGLGQGVIADVTAPPPVADQAAAFAALVSQASALKRLTVEVIPDTPPADPAPGLPRLRAGDRYRLKVSSQDRGSVYLVSLDADGRPTGLFVPEAGQEIDVDAGRPAVVPPDGAPTGAVTAPTDRQVVVLVRRRIAAPQASSQPTDLRVRLADFRVEADVALPTAPAPAVQILDSGASAPAPASPHDAGVARLLQMTAADPADAWLAQTVTVHIEPKRKAEVKPR